MADTDLLEKTAEEEAPEDDEDEEGEGDDSGSSSGDDGSGSGSKGPRQKKNAKEKTGKSKTKAPKAPGSGGGVGGSAGGGVEKQVATKAAANPYVIGGVIIVVVIIVIIMLITGAGAGDAPLTITKTGPTEAAIGEELNYQIGVSYPGTAQDIVITDRIPDGTEFMEASPAANFDPATKTATWNLKNNIIPPATILSSVNTVISLKLRATADNSFLVNQAIGAVVGAGAKEPVIGGGPIGDIAKLLPNPLPPDPAGVENSKNQALSAITQHKSVYEAAAAATGVPWQVFAGIHYREGGAAPNTSLVSGRPIGGNEPDVVDGPGCSNDAPQGVEDGIPEPFSGGCKFASMLDSGIYGGTLLKGKVGGELNTFEDLVKALSRYNGGGNANCGKGVPYNGCPRLFEGEDDPYALNFFDEKHKPMYVIYCADYTKCDPPREDGRPGTATVAKWATQSTSGLVYALTID